MAKSSIRKTDPAASPAPATRRRTTASDTREAKPAVKAAPRTRRTTVAAAAPVANETRFDGHSPVESTFDVPHEDIAVRAYHIYLERGFAGDSMHDWVTAERELREQVTRPRG